MYFHGLFPHFMHIMSLFLRNVGPVFAESAMALQNVNEVTLLHFIYFEVFKVIIFYAIVNIGTFKIL